MKRRIAVWRLAGAWVGAAALAPAVLAQASSRVPRIGVLRWGAAGDEAQVALIKDGGQFPQALDAMVRGRAQAVVVQPRFATSRPGPLAELLAQRKLPAVTSLLRFAASGGLMAYGFNVAELAQRTASFVDRLLKGASAAGLPIEEPTTYERPQSWLRQAPRGGARKLGSGPVLSCELVVNLKTARAIGIAIPQSLLLRANEVIQ